MNDTFINDLVAGKYRHLTPRPTDPSEPSLELLASLYLSERARIKSDRNILKTRSISVSLAAVLLASIPLFVLKDSGDSIQFLNLGILVLGVIIPFSLIYFAVGRRVTAEIYAEEYEKRIKLFWYDISLLAQVLRAVCVAQLQHYRREVLADRGFDIGAELQLFDRMYQDSRQDEKRAEAIETRRKLEVLHQCLLKFGLAPRGGIAAYGRRVRGGSERRAQDLQ